MTFVTANDCDDKLSCKNGLCCICNCDSLEQIQKFKSQCALHSNNKMALREFQYQKSLKVSVRVHYSLITALPPHYYTL